MYFYSKCAGTILQAYTQRHMRSKKLIDIQYAKRAYN